jgi:hypothetical protein
MKALHIERVEVADDGRVLLTMKSGPAFFQGWCPAPTWISILARSARAATERAEPGKRVGSIRDMDGEMWVVRYREFVPVSLHRRKDDAYLTLSRRAAQALQRALLRGRETTNTADAAEETDR